MPGQRLGDLTMPVPVGRHPVQVLAAHVEGCAAEVRVQPLVPIAAGEVDLLVVEVGRERAPRLDGVGVEVAPVSMGEVGQRGQVIAEAVAVRHPRHAEQPRPGVGPRGEVVDRHDAVPRRDDPQFDPLPALEFAVEHEGGDEVQLVHDHVVARPPVHRVHDDVLGPAGGVEEGELVLFGAEQAGEAGARTRHGLATRRGVAAPHLVVRVAVEGVADGHRQRSHRRIVEVGEFLGDRKTGPDAERIARGGARRFRLGAGSGAPAGFRWARERADAGKRGQPGGRRSLEEASPIPWTAVFRWLHGSLLDGNRGWESGRRALKGPLPSGSSVRPPARPNPGLRVRVPGPCAQASGKEKGNDNARRPADRGAGLPVRAKRRRARRRRVIVDTHPEAANAWIAGGGSGHGYQLGPALGEMLAGQALSEREKEPFFGLARFGG